MSKTRRILALIGIVLLLSMYVVCFVAAVTGAGNATTLFRAALGATIAVPFVLYCLLLIMKTLGPKDQPESDGSDETPER